MKNIIILTALLMLSGCTTSTRYGKCVGFNGIEDPKLQYEYSGWNIAMGVIWSEFVVPPIIVVLNELKCPVGVK